MWNASECSSRLVFLIGVFEDSGDGISGTGSAADLDDLVGMLDNDEFGFGPTGAPSIAIDDADLDEPVRPAPPPLLRPLSPPLAFLTPTPLPRLPQAAAEEELSQIRGAYQGLVRAADAAGDVARTAAVEVIAGWVCRRGVEGGIRTHGEAGGRLSCTGSCAR